MSKDKNYVTTVISKSCNKFQLSNYILTVDRNVAIVMNLNKNFVIKIFLLENGFLTSNYCSMGLKKYC